jgi:hypothetical protein
MLKFSTFVLTTLLSVTPAEACKCLASYPVCTEVAQTDVIFIGTVESVEPAFLDPWNADRLSLLPTDEILRLRQEGSPASLAKLKQIYLKLYPNMPVHYKESIIGAQTHTDLRKAFEAISAQDRQIRLRVKTVFQHKDDDDKDDDDNLTGKVVTVWTDSGDCGFSFQTGETYLVYADNDEETGQLATSICHRTSRLSDAGADLAYLYYLKNGGTNSTRLEGFVTSDPRAALQWDASRFATSIGSPQPGVVIKLNSGQTPRYIRTDPEGKFIFDGLAGGDYELSAFDAGYPQTVRQLGYPKSFHAEPNSCARQILTVPKD